MKLFEYQSHKILSEYGIPVPPGEIITGPEGAAELFRKGGGTCVLKAQVLTGGRGKAGGVKLVDSPEEAEQAAEKIFGLTIKGYPVESILVYRAFDIVKEYYLSLVVNRDTKGLECVFSAEGGIDIEETARDNPEKIVRIPVDLAAGIDREVVSKELKSSFKNEDQLEQALTIIENLYRLFTEKDCSLAEINPLALTDPGRIVAIDAKIVIDDNALVKHPELEELRNLQEYSQDEIDARNANLSFVSLEGTIGCMVNGAGLAMATMDLIKHFGEEPANFLDIGGSSNPQKVVDALAILLRNEKITAILMNIFGGITRCDDIARGIIMAKERIEIPVPFVIRLIGTNEEAGRSMLEEAGFHAYNDLTEAVKKVIDISRGH